MIADERNRLWSGEGFTICNGTLYARHNDAAIDAEHILRSHVAHITPVTYTVPLKVEVFADQSVSQANVAHYLSRAARLYLNTHEHGHGPKGSLVLACID